MQLFPCQDECRFALKHSIPYGALLTEMEDLA